jgi:hypothetical protein
MCRDEGIFADWANVYFEQFMKITQVAQNAQGKKLPFMKLHTPILTTCNTYYYVWVNFWTISSQNHLFNLQCIHQQRVFFMERFGGFHFD